MEKVATRWVMTNQTDGTFLYQREAFQDASGASEEFSDGIFDK